MNARYKKWRRMGKELKNLLSLVNKFNNNELGLFMGVLKGQTLQFNVNNNRQNLAEMWLGLREKYLIISYLVLDIFLKYVKILAKIDSEPKIWRNLFDK